jgi:hypothetical protein
MRSDVARSTSDANIHPAALSFYSFVPCMEDELDCQSAEKTLREVRNPGWQIAAAAVV